MSHKRCKTGGKLVNHLRKSYMRFRLVPKSVTLNDVMALILRYFTEFVYDVVVKWFTFAIPSPDEFLVIKLGIFFSDRRTVVIVRNIISSIFTILSCVLLPGSIESSLQQQHRQILSTSAKRMFRWSFRCSPRTIYCGYKKALTLKDCNYETSGLSFMAFTHRHRVNWNTV